MNHYEVLGVPPGTDTAAMKRAYLSAARQYHPDFHAHADEATRAANARKMQELNEAWEVLNDPASRVAYDRSVHSSDDPGVSRRAAREPDMPAGKGWTPRADDDGWMDDFETWANERDELPPDPPRSSGRSVLTMLPVGLFAAAVVCVFIGLVVKLNELVALGFICVILAAGLFIMLPMFEMSRGRRR